MSFTVVRLVCFRPGMPPPSQMPGGRRRIGAPESRTQIATAITAGTFRNHRPELTEIAGRDFPKSAAATY